MKLKHIPLLLLVLTCCPACQNKKASATKEIPSEATYTNPLLAVGAEPWAVFHEGKYYYTQGAENKIILWETNDITDSTCCPERSMDSKRNLQLLSPLGTGDTPD